jgi:transposase
MSLAEPPTFEDYSEARGEHAWLLRAEGLTFREIGQHLGVSATQAMNMVQRFSRHVQGAINRQRAKRVIVSNTQRWAIACQRAQLQAEADRWIEAWTTP